MELPQQAIRDAYEQQLKLIIRIIIFIHILLLFLRFALQTQFSLIQTLGLIQLVLLIFILIRDKCRLQAKSYIFISIFILFVIIINLLNSFSVEINYDSLIEENLPAQQRKLIYPIQFGIRSLCIVVTWRVYQYSHLKELHSFEFPSSDSSASY